MKVLGRRTVWLGAAVVAMLAAAGLAPASAKQRVDSFAGSCSFQGTVAFSPPATNTQQLLKVVYDANGTCDGTLDGRQVSGAPVEMHNEATADGSCLRADTIEPGHGAMEFADGTVIAYSLEFHYVGTDGVQTFQGERSGSALGHGSFLTQRTPPDTALKCAGEGAAEVPMDLSLTTQSPLESDGQPGAKRGGRRY